MGQRSRTRASPSAAGQLNCVPTGRSVAVLAASGAREVSGRELPLGGHYGELPAAFATAGELAARRDGRAADADADTDALLDVAGLTPARPLYTPPGPAD